MRGIATNDMGLDKKFKPKENFERGMEFRAKVTLFAEGCHGSLTKTLMSKFNLREGRQPQTYAIGIKEVWEVDPTKHIPGYCLHVLGWPLDYKTYGGGFMYHMENNIVQVGFVVALDYQNPYLNPYKEFQVKKIFLKYIYIYFLLIIRYYFFRDIKLTHQSENILKTEKLYLMEQELLMRVDIRYALIVQCNLL